MRTVLALLAWLNYIVAGKYRRNKAVTSREKESGEKK
jgi:hypothetical protein